MKFKTKWVFLGMMLIITLFGLNLRWYHLDYPVIGYHNWKETHYLTEARNFAEDGFFKHGFFMPEYDYEFHYERTDNLDGVHTDTFPTISVVVAILFKLFGEKLFLARLANIFFNIMVVPLMYLVVKELFENEYISLLAAALTSINPLFVFFSHNTQLINPGVFFMMLCLYLYVKWLKTNKSYLLIFSTVSFVISFLTKYSFFSAAFPILLTFPYKKVTQKKYWKYFGACVLILLLAPIYVLYTENYRSNLENTTFSSFQEGLKFDFGLVFRKSFWTPVKAYIRDNYTMFGFWLAVPGMIASVYFFTHKKSIKNKFLVGSIAGIVVFTFVVSHKLRGHNYHQYPIAPLIILFMSYFIYVVSKNAGKIIQGLVDFKYSHLVIGVLFVVLLYSPSAKAWKRQFNTQFPGLDIAGEYIREHSSSDERIIFSGHQSYGILWHASRKGYGGHDNLSKVKFLENKNVRWVHIYQWGFSTIQEHPDVWQYFEENYALRQVAFQQQGQNTNILHIVLEKGGSFSFDNISQRIQGKQTLQKNYEMTTGKYPVYYFNFPSQS